MFELRYGVRCISAAAFMRIALPLVYYRVKGIHRENSGRINTPNQVVAKVSRIEVARQFFSPPPERIRSLPSISPGKSVNGWNF